MNPKIRPVTANDIPQVFIIERESYPEPWPEKAFWDELENEICRFFVAEQDGLIIGFYDLWIYANVGHLLNIAIRLNYRNKGVATMLLGHIISESRDSNVEMIYLEVRESNEAAISLYRKTGFIKVGIKPGYYGDGENAVLMVVGLRRGKEAETPIVDFIRNR